MSKPPPSRKAHPIASTKKQLELFKRNVTFVARYCLSPLDQAYFNATKAPTRRLQHLAVLQNTPSMRGLPRLDSTTAGIITNAILSAMATCSCSLHVGA